MNDWYNDPPDYPEVPECCDQEMRVDDKGNCICDVCGNRIDAQPDIEPMEEPKCGECGQTYPCKCEDPYQGPPECPHHKPWGECDACDHLGDLAYDAARESRRS